jgi:hypothetical protein
MFLYVEEVAALIAYYVIKVFSSDGSNEHRREESKEPDYDEAEDQLEEKQEEEAGNIISL